MIRPVTEAWRRVGWEAAAVGQSSRRALTGPGRERDMAIQSLKAAGAAILAWAVAGWWWQAPLALMAPWTAVALVQSTVYRSVRTGVQQVVLIATGTVLAAAAARLTGDTMAAMAIVLPVTVLLGNYGRFGDQGIYASTTALFVLVYGSYSGFDILHRLLETLVGAAIGIAVNALVLPPVHLRDARDSLCGLPRDCAQLLRVMADEIEAGHGPRQAQEWHRGARRLSGRLTQLRNARMWTRESYRFNPALRMRRLPDAELPSTEWDAAWERAADHLTSLTALLSGMAGEQPRLSPPPGDVLADVLPLLRALADACEADCAALTDRDERPHAQRVRDDALARARAAHDRLKTRPARLAARDDGTATSVGGVAAETQQLLHDIEDARVE
ncbi:aromatic acid exporter family protein [Streptomyces sp. NPDC006368]|uniref:FUSC family protein n=1 Tax=Streptomyces sp. NPDC006368 TaxID=3156760 RepID=UPI0033AE2F2E